MRKFFVSILLLLSLVMPLVLQLGLLFHHKNEMKDELKELLEERKIQKDIVILVFTEKQFQSELKWEHDHEFEYQGQMYDVIETTQEDGKYQIRCYKDVKENKLKEKITRFLAFGTDDDIQKKDTQKKLSHFFHVLYFENSQVQLNYYSVAVKAIIPDHFRLLITDLDISDPPPKLS